MQDIGEIVSSHRHLSGLTQAELAKLAGVGRTVIFDIEHGKETIRYDTLRKVLEVLNVRINLEGPLTPARTPTQRPPSEQT